VDRTIAVEGAKKSQNLHIYQEKSQVVAQKPSRQGQAYVAADASLAQAETLRVAQERIHELEAEVDHLRKDNDDLASAGQIITQKMEGLQSRALRAEKEKNEVIAQFKNEVLILKGHLQYKDSELSKAKTKIEELDSRIKTDFKKIRVRERELENRLELVRAEKQALMRSKDDRILDLQRKVDQFKSELDLYRTKVQDLNKTMEDQQDQMRKTVRALRVALSNLEQESPIDEMSVTEAENSDKEKAE
jgi:chromosome segregation ATPase